jgi:DNA invertase Pin-like site-specific DNA recombinase
VIDRARVWKTDRCLVYGRCSTQLQDASIEDQLSTVRTEMSVLGLTGFVAPPFVDDGLRGHDESRPGLLAILEYVRTHPNRVERNSEFIPILVYDVSRFGRFDDPKKIFSYFVEIERYGYEFYSVTERIRSRGNIADWVQLIIRSEQAGQYSVDLSKYGLRTGCELATKGWWPGGQAPYGFDRVSYGQDGKPKYRYRSNPDRTVSKYTFDGHLLEVLPAVEIKGKKRSAYSDKLRADRVKLVPGDAKVVEIVRSIFVRYAQERKGLRKIASELNSRGIPPPGGRGGRKWLLSTVRSILTNPGYKGSLVYGRRSDGKHHWLSIEKTEKGYSTRIEKKDVARRTFVHRTIEECIVIEDAHPALIPKDLWERAQYRMEKNQHASDPGFRCDRSNRSDYLLSGDGLMKCVSCGYSYQGDTDRRTRKRYYMDSGYHAGGKSVCRCSYVPAEQVEGWIIDKVAEKMLGGRLFKFNDVEELARDLAPHLPSPRAEATRTESVAEIERRILEKKRKAALVLRILDEETASLAKEELRTINRELKDLEAALGEAQRRASTKAAWDPLSTARAVADELWDFRRVIEEGTADEKKQVIRAFVGEIQVDAAKRLIRVGFFKIPEVEPSASGSARKFFPQLWSPQRDSNPCRGLEKSYRALCGVCRNSPLVRTSVPAG